MQFVCIENKNHYNDNTIMVHKNPIVTREKWHELDIRIANAFVTVLHHIHHLYHISWAY